MEARNQWGWGRQSDVFKFFTRTKGRYLELAMMGEYSFTHYVQTLDLQILVWTDLYGYGAVILEIIKL